MSQTLKARTHSLKSEVAQQAGKEKTAFCRGSVGNTTQSLFAVLGKTVEGLVHGKESAGWIFPRVNRFTS